jgi:hypothetical protein
MLNKLLSKLIRNSAGQARFVMALLGLSVAILLLLSAVQLQVNYYQLLHAKNNQDSIANFLVVNKAITDQTVGASSLTEDQLADLKKQPFIDQVGKIVPSRFKVSLQSKSDRFPFYTDIAFETVPSEFIDVTSKDWHWDEQSNFLPIIVPNQFLDFYNFQFSFSQNLPQLTAQVVKMVVFKVTIQTAAGPVSMNGRVVGLSNRISSMLVPQEFMEWANKNAGAATEINQSSRVVIKTKDPGNPLLVDYLKAKGLVTDAEKTRFSKYRQVVDFVVSLSGLAGLFLLIFAMLIFTLFIQLTIASCKEEIALLVLLGSSPTQLRKFLMARFMPANFIIVSIGVLLIAVAQWVCSDWLKEKQIYLDNWISRYTILAAIGIVLLIVFVNYYTIGKYLKHRK